MKRFFPEVYGWLRSLYSNDLYDYLDGYNCDSQAFDGFEQFTSFGLWMLLITVVVAVVYYLVLNHPRLNHLWHWLVAMFLSVVANFFVAFIDTNSSLDNGLIPDCLLYERDEEGEIINQLIYTQDCVLFGVSNAIISALVFFLVSIGFKYASRNCKCVPF